MESLDYYKRRLKEKRNATVLRALGLITGQKAQLAVRRRKLDDAVRRVRGMIIEPEPAVVRGPAPRPTATPLTARLGSARWRVREEAAKEALTSDSLDDATRARLLELLGDEQWLVARAALKTLLAHDAVAKDHQAIEPLLDGPHQAAFAQLLEG